MFYHLLTHDLLNFEEKYSIEKPSQHSARVSPHNKGRPKLGWTITYKALYFATQHTLQECEEGLGGP